MAAPLACVIVAASMKALLIDHDDSFTQNLKHWLSPSFDDVHIINHLQISEVQSFSSAENHFDLVVLSPGPKSPKDYPHILHWLQMAETNFPIFGVCLGLQMMAQISGHSVSTYSPPKHGKTSNLKIYHPNFKSFEDLAVARYHSLRVDSDIEKNFHLIAQAADDHSVMWLQHKTKKWQGVQFHPESFITEKPNLHLQALQQWVKN